VTNRTPLSEIVKAYDVRGLVGTQFDAGTAWALGAAFAEEVTGAEPGVVTRIAIGYDMRPSSPELSGAFARGAASRGLDVVVIGLCSTDGLYYASGSLDCPGAMFTASHNPAAYNGIKMCRAGARPIGQDTGLARIRDRAQELLDTKAEQAEQNADPAGAGPVGTISADDLLRGYAEHLRGLVDLSGVRPLKVVVDAGNGMGGLTTPAVLGTAAGLAALPLDVVPLYFELDGTFPNHEANPLEPENLRDLQAAVVAAGADLGLAFDGDADRCFVVDERGEPVNPSAVTAMVARREIAKETAAGRPARVIHNLISSRAVREVIEASGGTAVRTRVGHSFIKATMAEQGAVFGGEHSAHYYFRDFWFADTGMLAAMHVLAALGGQPLPLSQLAAEFQPYPTSGEINSRVTDVEAATARVEAAFAGRPGVETDRMDGLSVVHAGTAGTAGRDGMWWFNLRPSNTEPLLRLNAEAHDAPTMAALRDEVLALVRQA